MKVVAIIQARMGSTRLPGKVLKNVLNKSLLEYEIERIKRASFIDEIVIATTGNEEDDAIINKCHELSVPYFRGAEEDVLSRYYHAAVDFHADAVVRLTADCPLIDPNVIDKMITTYLTNRKLDYVSNTIERTYPRGMDVEVISKESLFKLHEKALEKSDREHVTSYILKHLNDFRVENVKYKHDFHQLRLTVDTMEDFNLIKRLIEHLYPKNNAFTLEDILDLFHQYPDWKKINAHIEQKKI